MYLDNFMEKLKKDNPDANWTNLLTGVGILVLVAVFSVWYFGNSDSNVFTGAGGENDDIEQSMEGEGNIETDENGEPLEPNQVKVQAGEGLWHVAERVCGDGELYNHIAQANELSIWSRVNENQILTVTCDYETVSTE